MKQQKTREKFMKTSRTSLTFFCFVLKAQQFRTDALSIGFLTHSSELVYCKGLTSLVLSSIKQLLINYL